MNAGVTSRQILVSIQWATAAIFLGWVDDSKLFYLCTFPWESVTDTEVGFGRVDMAAEWGL